MNKAHITSWLTVGDWTSCAKSDDELVIHIFRTDTTEKQEALCAHPETRRHLRMNYRDGDEIDASNLTNLNHVVGKLRVRRVPTLCHCRAGIVRSPTIAIYLLVFVDNYTPFDAHTHVMRQVYEQRGEVCNIYYLPFKQIVKRWEREKASK